MEAVLVSRTHRRTTNQGGREGEQMQQSLGQGHMALVVESSRRSICPVTVLDLVSMDRTNSPTWQRLKTKYKECKRIHCSQLMLQEVQALCTLIMPLRTTNSQTWVINWCNLCKPCSIRLTTASKMGSSSHLESWIRWFLGPSKTVCHLSTKPIPSAIQEMPALSTPHNQCSPRTQIMPCSSEEGITARPTITRTKVPKSMLSMALSNKMRCLLEPRRIQARSTSPWTTPTSRHWSTQMVRMWLKTARRKSKRIVETARLPGLNKTNLFKQAQVVTKINRIFQWSESLKPAKTLPIWIWIWTWIVQLQRAPRTPTCSRQ